MSTQPRWDIFCQVIDNYGDIGVCWRLARQLVAEHGLQVRLWLDDLASLQLLCPEIDPQQDTQRTKGVQVCHWRTPFPHVEAADVVIEAFGCPLPDNYVAAMTQRQVKPCWVNLEYLSAEPWIDGCHGLTSPQPRLPLTKHFYFPGFTATSGGLLREHDVPARRQHWQAHPQALRDALQLPPPLAQETLVSLFCYDSAPIADVLSAWANSPALVRCLLPQGKALQQAAAWLGDASLTAGDMRQRGNLTLHIRPFVRQQDYDLLLWACDCNFVRGEDSFVRAQWAARPLVWQIYKQEEDAHYVKLDAFLDRYCAGLDADVVAALRAMHHAWNGRGIVDWAAFWQHGATLKSHAASWAARLEEDADLASKLVIFCKNRV